MFKKTIFVILTVFMLLVTACPVMAQTDTQPLKKTFAILEVDLRPHFDQPDVLVIYHMVLGMDERLPATVEVRIPAASGQPSAVQSVDPVDGGLNSIQYNSRQESEWIIVTFVATTREINFEYHDPALIRDGVHLNYQFNWQGDYDIENLSLYIEQPVGAENMLITPSLGSAKTDQEGVVYYYSSLGKLASGTTFSIGIQYDKADDSLSKSQLPVVPSAPLNENTEGRTTIREMAPWLIGIVIGLLVGAAAWWMWVWRNSPKHRLKSQRHRPALSSFDEDGDRIYCHECGQRAVKGDVYCRVCGAKLRK